MGRMKVRVLFVCLGNICRSPMAEGIFRKLLKERGLEDRFEVDSAGTGAYHVGEDADPRTRRVLERHGAAFPHTARQVTREDLAGYDYILAMDRENLRALERLAPPEHREKLHLVLEPLGGGEVPDPYYGDLHEFEEVYLMLEEALARWLDRMTVHAA